MKWYKMDCDNQANLDMRKLVAEWGWDWLGRYHALIGMVGMQVNEKHQTFTLQTNNGQPVAVKQLADDLGTTVQRMTDFLSYLAENHLIDRRRWKQKGLIYMPKLRERADEYTKKLLRKSGQHPAQEEEVEGEVEGEHIHPPREARPKSIGDLIQYFKERGEDESGAIREATKFLDHYKSVDWVVGASGKKMKDWRAAVRNWLSRKGNFDGRYRGNGNGRSSAVRSTGTVAGPTSKAGKFANVRGTYAAAGAGDENVSGSVVGGHADPDTLPFQDS